MSRRNERKRDSRRSVATRPQYKSIRVYSEGKVVEPCYIEMLNASFQSVNIQWIDKDSGQPAAALINAAKKYKKENKSGDLPDQIWCLWDVDSLDDAEVASLEHLAGAAGIKNAISNPCFELWLLLHYRSHATPIEKHKLQSSARTAGIIDGSKVCCCHDWLFSRIEMAHLRAVALEEGYIEAGSQKFSNPGSGMHGLLQAVIDLQKEYDETYTK